MDSKLQMQLNKNPQQQKKQDKKSIHKNKYEKIINNIYQEVKQKEYQINHPQTHQIDDKDNHNVSSLSSRSLKINDVKQCLPKLSIKDVNPNQLFDVLLTYENRVSKTNQNIRKNILSGSINRSNINNQFNYNSSNIKYKISESKLSNSSIHIPCAMIIQTKDKRIESKQKKIISANLPNYSKRSRSIKSDFERINKDNMNLLGLNVQKVNYSQKKDNKRYIYLKMTQLQQKKNNNQQDLQLINQQNNKQDNTKFKNIDDLNYNSLLNYDKMLINDKLTKQNQNFVDMDLCQLLLNQKMQIGKKFLAKEQLLKISHVYSPSKMKKRISSSSNKNHIIPFNISPDQQLNPIYQGRYRKYLDFILKISFSYKIYGQLDQQINTSMHVQIRSDKKYKAWIGNGNNGNLLKALIKRRFWWQIIQEKSYNVNFLWTQLKNNDYYKVQRTKQNKKYETIENVTTQCDQSSSLSMQDSRKIQHKSCSFRTSRIQSSLPGTIIDKRKTITSSFKRTHIKQQDCKNLYKIFNEEERIIYKKISSSLQNKTFNQKLQIMNIQKFNPIDSYVHNHLMNNFYLGNKKALFYNLKQYYELKGGDLFKTVPLTFHIKKGIQDLQYKRFLAYYKKRQSYIKRQQKQMQKQQYEQKRKMRNIWIVKPGENTNRGNGITVIDQIYQFNSILKSQGVHQDGSQKTFIIQLYIDRPLLYKKRKFDIRHYMLITHIKGIMKGYWFEQGYIRTSGYEFNIEEFQRQIHLTNDAVQKYTSNYGRFQPGNKLSYTQFQKYLDSTYQKKNYNFYQQILPRMKQICLDSIKSSFLKLSPEKFEHNFQLFGMDFMIDNDFVPWLIEINTNPCLQITCALQARLLPQVVDQTLRLTLDVVYPPPCHYPNTYRHLVPQASLQNMKYELIFDERIHGQQTKKLYQNKKNSNLLEQIGQLQDDQVYQNQGQLIKLDEVLQ